MITLRPATAEDQQRIVAFIRAAHINPMNLKWSHFVLAIDATSGALVGTGQIKTHGDGSREVASIAVAPDWQGRGIARQVIEHLLAQNAGTLFLTCRSSLEPLYARFGFRAVGPEKMTPYFRRLNLIAKGLLPLMRRGEKLRIMRRDA